jgi:membrane-associated phospholipid phosphatase
MRPHLALWLALWLAALAGFIVIAAFASAHDTFPADIWMAHRLQEIHSGFFSDVLNRTADFADLPLLAGAIVVGAAVFFGLAGPVPALLVLASVPLARPFNIAVKALVDRPRPSSSIVRVESHPTDAAFPSGHAEAAIALYGMVFYLAAVYVKDARIRLPLQLLSAWVIVLTAFQRVYSGEHWPSDVVGGTLLGGLALAALIAAHRLYLTSARRPESQSAAVR